MAIVLLSGGQDSATALLWSQEHLQEPLQALSFSYGQRHLIELECARRLTQRLGVPHTVLELGPLWSQWGIASALTAQLPIEEKPNVLPTTFVPGRNLLFLVVAAIWGYPRGETRLVIGASQVDYSGYPDCRGPFMTAAQAALAYALDRPIEVLAPFLDWDKAQLWRYAERRGARELIAEETHTCYRGERTLRHPWGYGCGECPACRLRKAGYESAFS